jgi:NADH-quinone oxidoreductase subunit G
MCQVEFVSDRGSRLGISCNQPVGEGMNIVTDSDMVKRARASVEEMLLLNHPLDCPICDKAGECTLQNYYMQHDMKDSRQAFTRFKKRKALDIGPTMVLDQERCVLCNRCVRFLRDWAGQEQLYIAGRAHEAFLTNFPGKPVDNPYSLNTVDLCPVGALTSKDFRFSTPTWMLKRTPSTCTSCARGCSIYVDVDTRDNKVKRLRPRHNPHVNGYWMCDEGRLNYKFVNDARIRNAAVRRGEEPIETSLENAMNELRNMLGLGVELEEEAAPGELVIVVSASCTLEEMYALKELAARANTSIYVARHVADGEQDHLLRRANRHANVKGAELLGLKIVDYREGAKDEDGIGDVGEGAVLFAVGFEYDVAAPLEALADKFSKVAVMASCKSGLTDKAHVLIPGLTFAEKEGLIVNFEGHIQQLSPGFDDLWDKTSPWEIVVDLIKSATGEIPADNIAALRSALIKEEAAFDGINLNAVTTSGLRLEAQVV